MGVNESSQYGKCIMLVIYQSIPKRMITSKLGKYQKTGYLIKSLWQFRTKLFDLHGFTISHDPRSYVWTLTQRSYIVCVHANTKQYTLDVMIIRILYYLQVCQFQSCIWFSVFESLNASFFFIKPKYMITCFYAKLISWSKDELIAIVTMIN